MRGTCSIVKFKCEKKKHFRKKKRNKENLISERVIMFLTHPFNLFSTACELSRYIGELIHESQVLVLINHIFCRTF